MLNGHTVPPTGWRSPPSSASPRTWGRGCSTPNFNTLCESESTPLRISSLPGYLAGIQETLQGGRWNDGHVLIHNHPYYGSNHSPDIAVVIPVFHKGQDERLGGDWSFDVRRHHRNGGGIEVTGELNSNGTRVRRTGTSNGNGTLPVGAQIEMASEAAFRSCAQEMLALADRG